MYKDTSELRDSLNKLLSEVESGKVSNAAARTRVNISRAMLETLKVEIAAASLGTAFTPLSLQPPMRVVSRRS